MLSLLLALAAAAGQSAAVHPDLAYGARPEQRLDLHLPGGPPRATVLFIHGGSLSESGERRSSPMYAGVCPALAREGLACATMDYRLSPSHVWPAMAEDVAAAVAWLRTNLPKYGAPPGRLVVFGHSSGCHLAAVVGANPRFLAAQGLTPSDLAGIVAMGCVLSPTEEVLSRRSIDALRQRPWPPDALYPTMDAWLDADASRFLGPHMPPVLVLLAERERFFPAILEQGAKFARRLLEVKRPADVVIVPGGHVSSIQEIARPGSPVLAAVLAFVTAHAGGQP